MRRSLLTTTMAVTLASLLAAPAAAATTTRGTAATSSVPLHVEAADVPVELGRLSLLATTDSERVDLAPWSTVGLTLLDVAGTTFGDVSARSDGEPTSDGLRLSRATDVGTVGATAGSVLAVADDVAGSATSALTTLTTQATVLQNLGVNVTVSDVVARVDDTGASATHTLMLAGVDLDLAAVLGAELLGQLPLDALLALADELGIAVPANLGNASEVVAATTTLLAEVADVVTTSDAVRSTADDLIAAFGSLPAEITEAVAAVEGLDVTSPTIIADLSAVLLAFTGDATACNAAPVVIDQAALDAIVVCLYDVALGDEFTALDDAVSAYLDAVSAAALAAEALDPTTVEDILDGVLELVQTMAGTDLLGIGETEVTQEVRAVGGSLAASSASHTCNVTSVTVIGADPVEVADCDGDGSVLTDLLSTIDGAIRPVLDAVGGVDAAPVQLTLFGVVEETVDEAPDGWVRATSTLEVLRLTVPDITITACDVETLGQVVCALGTDLLGPLEDALTELQAAQSIVTSSISDAGAAISALAETIDASAGTDAATAVDDTFAVLSTVLGGLPLGELGTVEGITVPGATIVVDPELEAEHQVITTAGSPDPTNPAPDPDDPTLPNTGGGAAALALLALGASAMLRRRRESD